MLLKHNFFRWIYKVIVCLPVLEYSLRCLRSSFLSFFLFLTIALQNLQSSHGHQREFGDGQRDRQKTPLSLTASEDENVILNSIKNRGIQGQKMNFTL